MITTKKPTRSHAISIAVTALLPILSPTAAWGEPVNEQDALTAAQTWVRLVTADARPDAVVERMEPYVVDGRTAAYIVHLAGGGYCLCGADDRLLPVYLYRPSGAFDPADPNYRFILHDIATRLGRLEQAKQQQDPVLQQYQATLTQRRADWGELIAERPPVGAGGEDDRGDPDYVTLDVSSYWRQGSPYNDQCPEMQPGTDTHTLVGCVATASSQIMYYWQWPDTGVGSDSVDYEYRHRSTWDSEPLAVDPNIPGGWGSRLEWVSWSGGQLRMNGVWDGSIYGSARNISEDATYRTVLENLWNRMTVATTACPVNFGATTYNWSILKDEHSDPPGSDDVEVAELCYHAAVALHMGFGVWASSSHTSHAPEALPSHFRYDSDLRFDSRNEYTMMEEIRWFRPVQLGGQSDSGGHSWVVCGYNSATSPVQFLMNMGWGGGSTEWYSVDEVFPNDQGHSTRIAPVSGVDFVDYGVFGGDGSPNNPYLGLSWALGTVPDDTTLVMKAGSTHTLPGDPIVLDRPMTFKGYDVTITRE